VEVFGFLTALQTSEETNMPATETTVIDKTTDPGVLQLAAKKRNAIVVANLTMAFTTDGAMALLYKSKTAACPNRFALLIADALKHKYQPQDTTTWVELRHWLNKVTLKKGADPASQFEQISTIKNKYNTLTRTIDREDLIAVVIDAAPQEYQSVLASKQLQLGNSVLLKHLNMAMTACCGECTLQVVVTEEKKKTTS
jgi:hypothetical protein